MRKLILTQSSTGVTLSSPTANIIDDYAYYEVPKGIGVIIPGRFVFILKLQKSDGSDISVTSKLYFGFRTPTQPDRTIPCPNWYFYRPWSNLSISNQRDVDNQAAITVDLGIPQLALVEDEYFYLEVNTSDTIATANTVFEIPYVEQPANAVRPMLVLRRQVFGA